jgi:hypothetical protein
MINQGYIREMKEYFSNQIKWKKEVDPDLVKTGTDCTIWVPEKPWWDGMAVEHEKTGIRYQLKFDVHEGETPRMGGDYVKITPLRFSDDFTIDVLEGREKIKDDTRKLKNYWHEKVLPAIKNFKYKIFERPSIRIKITK